MPKDDPLRGFLSPLALFAALQKRLADALRAGDAAALRRGLDDLRAVRESEGDLAALRIWASAWRDAQQGGCAGLAAVLFEVLT